YPPLSKSQKKKWRKHFNRKNEFNKEKEAKDWLMWPKKFVKESVNRKEKKKKSCTHRNIKRKAKKIREKAACMITDGDVRILVDLEIPPEAIVVLGKGLGYVPTPCLDTIETRLDARQVTNKITYLANRSTNEDISVNEEHLNSTEEFEEESDVHSFSLPKGLRQPNYFQAHLKNTNPEFTATLNYINTKTNNIGLQSQRQKRNNLSVLEERGLRWLKNEISNQNISVCKADKGGAILVVHPEMLSKKVEDKVTKASLYEELSEDPREEIYDKMLDIWRIAQKKKYVTNQEAKEVVGLTEKGNKSTSSRFKYGRTYFNPSLKIQKMKTEELVPGCNVPARIITCLQGSVTKRSDVYIADTWLKSLEKDYCVDLVKDSTETLVWLDELNDTAKQSRRHYNPFTFDFESLYDSLGRDLILEALWDAMDTCRPEWSTGFKSWLIDLVQLSIDSAIGEYRGKFYRPKGGCPTGGSLSVQIANVTVFFVLNKVLYQDK
ncbi:MAG TPA: hypothetical protein DDE71_04180, partial [Tenacibaculum sp.]|nr:hypothetical protein [Tenacibaculum sp.]